MALTITHAKTNTIPDWTQADLDAQIALGNFPPGTLLADIVLPGDWNDDHSLSGSVDWGEITGTLSDQTDLQSALDGKQATGNYITALTGEVTASGPGSVAATVTNSAVIGKVLTGFSAGAGTVSATDTILQGFNKIVGNIAALVSGVSSVFGRTGAVTAQSGDYNTSQVTENTNLYFTDERAQDAIGSIVNTSLTYNDSTPSLVLTPRTINGTTFDGTGNITITAAAGTLTGSTLASNVVTSSITSLGSQAQDLNMNSHKVTNVTDPTSAQDAATKAYVDAAVTGLLDYRGSYDASSNLFPSTGGSGLLGAVLKGDFWVCSVAGTLGGDAVTPGDLIIALEDTPGQTAANWDLIEHNIGTYVSSVSGTTNRITSTGGTTPAIDISSSYVGQSSITTLGTVGTGTWQGTAVAEAYGGVPTGGASGAVLTKDSGSNYDASWQDISAIYVPYIGAISDVILGDVSFIMGFDAVAGSGGVNFNFGNQLTPTAPTAPNTPEELTLYVTLPPGADEATPGVTASDGGSIFIKLGDGGDQTSGDSGNGGNAGNLTIQFGEFGDGVDDDGGTGYIRILSYLGATILEITETLFTLTGIRPLFNSGITGVTTEGSSNPSNFKNIDTSNNAPSSALEVAAGYSGTVAAGFGVGITFLAQNTSFGTDTTVGQQQYIYDAISTDYVSQKFTVRSASSQVEPFRIGASASGVYGRFFGLAQFDGEMRVDGTPAADDTATGFTTNTFNAGATISQWQVVYQGASFEWLLANATVSATSGDVLLALAAQAGTDNNPLLVVMPGGYARNDAWSWSPGAIYLDTTNGAMTQTAPSGTTEIVRVVAYATSADTLYWMPSGAWVEVA